MNDPSAHRNGELWSSRAQHLCQRSGYSERKLVTVAHKDQFVALAQRVRRPKKLAVPAGGR